MKNHYLALLREIKSVAMASVDKHGNPQVRIIDVMMIENGKLYFCTARGKSFYEELFASKQIAMVALSSNYEAVRLNGEVIHLKDQKTYIDKIFELNPAMKDVYPNTTRYILEAFCVENAMLECFDLHTHPISRKYTSMGNAKVKKHGFIISNQCINCGKCATICPQQCIQLNESRNKYEINAEHCLYCGLCYENCPVKAIRRREGYVE